MKKKYILMTVYLFVFQLFIAQSDLINIFQNDALKGSITGIYVSYEDGKKIFETNAHIQMSPASIFKLLTSWVMIETKGTNYKWTTDVYMSGKITADGVLDGNLYIKGMGDPSIKSKFFSSTDLLSDLVNTIKNNGIKKIKGNLIIDNAYYTPKINGSWIWEDINNYYAAIPYPINIYDNKFHIYFNSNQEGDKADITNISPQYISNPIHIESQIVSKGTTDEAYVYGDPLGFNKRILGSIPPNQKEYSIEAVLPNSALMFAEQLIQKLNNNQINISNTGFIVSTQDTINYLNLKLINTHYSPPLDKIIQQTNLHSINLFAESFLYALGDGNYELGKKKITSYLSKNKFPVDEIFIDDACGLSRLNGISPYLMCSLLQTILLKKDKNSEVFLNSIPVAGSSGTLKNFGKNSLLENNLHAKTGYMKRVRSYTGYLTAASGKKIIFCLIFNNFNCSTEKIKQISKTFFETLYQHY